jgi:hypothetical protein
MKGGSTALMPSLLAAEAENKRSLEKGNTGTERTERTSHVDFVQLESALVTRFMKFTSYLYYNLQRIVVEREIGDSPATHALGQHL